jgi:hypothetical protein
MLGVKRDRLGGWDGRVTGWMRGGSVRSYQNVAVRSTCEAGEGRVRRVVAQGLGQDVVRRVGGRGLGGGQSESGFWGGVSKGDLLQGMSKRTERLRRW